MNETLAALPTVDGFTVTSWIALGVLAIVVWGLMAALKKGTEAWAAAYTPPRRALFKRPVPALLWPVLPFLLGAAIGELLAVAGIVPTWAGWLAGTAFGGFGHALARWVDIRFGLGLVAAVEGPAAPAAPAAPSFVHVDHAADPDKSAVVTVAPDGKVVDVHPLPAELPPPKVS